MKHRETNFVQQVVDIVPNVDNDRLHADSKQAFDRGGADLRGIDPVDASGRASIGGSGVLKARPPKMAENARAIFARWEWAIEFMKRTLRDKAWRAFLP